MNDQTNDQSGERTTDDQPRRSGLGRWLRRLILLLIVVLGAGGAYYGYWIEFEHRLVKINERLYQSAEMSPEVLVEAAKENGIRTVIDLRNSTPKRTAAEADACEKAGLRFVHLPSEHEITDRTVERFLDVMDKHAEGAALVHCEHGQSRSVMLAAVYRMEHDDWSNEKALIGTARIPDAYGFLRRVFPGLGAFKRTGYKGKFVLDYVRKRASKDR